MLVQLQQKAVSVDPILRGFYDYVVTLNKMTALKSGDLYLLLNKYLINVESSQELVYLLEHKYFNVQSSQKLVHLLEPMSIHYLKCVSLSFCLVLEKSSL